MLDLEAGRHPHVVTRPCRDRAEAERWAHQLAARGFLPVTIDRASFSWRKRTVRRPNDWGLLHAAGLTASENLTLRESLPTCEPLCLVPSSAAAVI